MSSSKKLLISGVVAAAMLAAPVAAFAQTSNSAQSTGDRESAKERSEMDTTRKHQSATPMAAKKSHKMKSGKKSGVKSGKTPVPATNTRS